MLFKNSCWNDSYAIITIISKKRLFFLIIVGDNLSATVMAKTISRPKYLHETGKIKGVNEFYQWHQDSTFEALYKTNDIFT